MHKWHTLHNIAHLGCCSSSCCMCCAVILHHTTAAQCFSICLFARIKNISCQTQQNVHQHHSIAILLRLTAHCGGTVNGLKCPPQSAHAGLSGPCCNPSLVVIQHARSSSNKRCTQSCWLLLRPAAACCAAAPQPRQLLHWLRQMHLIGVMDALINPSSSSTSSIAAGYMSWPKMSTSSCLPPGWLLRPSPLPGGVPLEPGALGCWLSICAACLGGFRMSV